MKKLFIFSVIALLLTSCGVGSGLTKEEEAALAAIVKTAVNNQNVNIDITQIKSQHGFVSTPIPGQYFINIKGQKSTAHIPFMGTANMGGVFSDNLSLDIKDEPVEVKYDKSSAKKGKYVIRYKAKYRGTTWDLRITLWDNASVDISADIPGRSMMRYEGVLKF